MGADPRAAGFVNGWAVAFALETIVDPLAVGVGGVSMVPFVLLGDFRVFLLFFGVLEPERHLAGTFARAAAWTLVVPVLALSLCWLARQMSGPLPEQALWLIYECAFVARARGAHPSAGGALPARRPGLRRHLLRALGGRRRAHHGRQGRRLGSARDSEPALLRSLGAGRVDAVLLAAIRLDEQVGPDP